MNTFLDLKASQSFSQAKHITAHRTSFNRRSYSTADLPLACCQAQQTWDLMQVEMITALNDVPCPVVVRSSHSKQGKLACSVTWHDVAWKRTPRSLSPMSAHQTWDTFDAHDFRSNSYHFLTTYLRVPPTTRMCPKLDKHRIADRITFSHLARRSNVASFETWLHVWLADSILKHLKRITYSIVALQEKKPNIFSSPTLLHKTKPCTYSFCCFAKAKPSTPFSSRPASHRRLQPGSKILPKGMRQVQKKPWGSQLHEVHGQWSEIFGTCFYMFSYGSGLHRWYEVCRCLWPFEQWFFRYSTAVIVIIYYNNILWELLGGQKTPNCACIPTESQTPNCSCKKARSTSRSLQANRASSPRLKRGVVDIWIVLEFLGFISLTDFTGFHERTCKGITINCFISASSWPSC